jgi:hypothetical protein
MVDWKLDAINAFKRTWNNTYTSPNAQIRATLDAAVKAQGIRDNIAQILDIETRRARAEALEEAAQHIEVILPDTNKDFAAGKRWCAAAIRALKDKDVG